MKLLRLHNLGQQFSPSAPWLFRGLSEQFSEGERCALVGPSGSGKSTLLSIIAGWLPASEGRIERGTISRVQWVFQNPHGVARRAAIDHVTLPFLVAGLSPRDADTRSLELCHTVGLSHLQDRRPFAMLSGGEAQRLMLARAIAGKPELLLVDEPTAQLDRRSAATVNAAIASIGKAGGIVLIATHDPGTAAACDRTVDLSHYAADPAAADAADSATAEVRA